MSDKKCMVLTGDASKQGFQTGSDLKLMVGDTIIEGVTDIKIELVNGIVTAFITAEINIGGGK